MITAEQIDLAWLMTNRQRVADALNFVEALRRAEVQLGGPGSEAGLFWDGGGRASVVVPIRLGRIDPGGTDAQQIAAIRTALRQSGLEG
jgi:hypothetical protein